MENLRITDKFARTLNAFRGRDVIKKRPEQYLVRACDMAVFEWPKTQAETDEFVTMRGTEWFVLGGSVDAEEMHSRQDRVRRLEDELERARENDYSMRKEWMVKLSDAHRSKIVLFFYRSDKKPLTHEELAAMLRPGDEIISMGMRYDGASSSRPSLYVAILSIPGTRNKDVEYKYVKSRWEVDGRANEACDIEKTNYGKGDFSDHVHKVIYRNTW
jgi:hypothetical protein